MTYKICKALISAKKFDGLMEKLDVFYAAGRLTEKEYTDLVKLLNKATNK